MCTNSIAIFNNLKVQGEIQFHQCKNHSDTMVRFTLYGMVPNQVHGCHIHQYGDESEGCESLGPHWNPLGREHGSIFIDINDSHAGDLLNNITSDQNGEFNYEYRDPRIQLCGNINESIIGRSVVIHGGVDDLGQGGNKESKITGNSGKRVLCGVIGISSTCL